MIWCCYTKCWIYQYMQPCCSRHYFSRCSTLRNAKLHNSALQHQPAILHPHFLMFSPLEAAPPTPARRTPLGSHPAACQFFFAEPLHPCLSCSLQRAPMAHRVKVKPVQTWVDPQGRGYPPHRPCLSQVYSSHWALSPTNRARLHKGGSAKMNSKGFQ